jgi:hypothetical protein
MTAPTPTDAAPEPQATAQTQADQAPATDGGTWKPPATQADLDRIVQDRLARERAKFADYDDLASKAALWDEIEQASLTEFEKQSDALSAAEQRYQAAQQRIVTAELRAAGVPAELVEDLDLSRFVDGDGEIDEARIGALRDKYAALAPAGTPRMAPNPAQGTSAQPPMSLAERITQAQTAGDLKAVMRLKAAMAVSSSTTTN